MISAAKATGKTEKREREEEKKGEEVGGRKARADSPCADRNRREGTWVRGRWRRKEAKESGKGIIRAGNEKDASD